jgi:hypothetical protein
MKRRSIQFVAGAAFIAAAGITAFGSSHREAPGITGRPKLDGTDFYAFRSYEPGREGYVTLIANYIPLQDAYGGPNFFAWIRTRSTKSTWTTTATRARTSPSSFGSQTSTGTSPCRRAAKNIPIPLINIGPIGPNPGDTANLNALETYSVRIIRGDRRTGVASCCATRQLERTAS